MAIDAATNCWTIAEQALVDALPQQTAFQTFVGAADATEAANHIFVDVLNTPWDGEAYAWQQRAELGAYAIVSSASEDGYQIVRGPAIDAYEPSGRLVLMMSRMVKPMDLDTQETEAGNYQQVERWFKNQVGDLIQEVGEYWFDNGGPWLASARVVDGPWHNDIEEHATHGHWQGIVLELMWGMQTRQ